MNNLGEEAICLNVICNILDTVICGLLLIYYLRHINKKSYILFLSSLIGFCAVYYFTKMFNTEVGILTEIFMVWFFIFVTCQISFYSTIVKAGSFLAICYICKMAVSLLLTYSFQTNESDSNLLFLLTFRAIELFVLIIYDKFGLRTEPKSRYLAIPIVISTTALILNTYIILDIKAQSSELFYAATLVMILIIFTSLSFICFFEKYAKTKEREQHLTLLRLQNEEQYNLYLESMKNTEHIKRLNHDIKNHINYLLYCLEKHLNDEGIEYAKRIVDSISVKCDHYVTGNHMLDFLLNSIAEKCIDNGIEFDADIAFDFSTGFVMNDFDMCTLFANILANAYEASLNLKKSSVKLIVMKVVPKDRYLIIKTTNHYRGSYQTESDLTTKKADKELHGWGLKNIERIVYKYDGVKKITLANNKFEIRIMLPLLSVLSEVS